VQYSSYGSAAASYSTAIRFRCSYRGPVYIERERDRERNLRILLLRLWVAFLPRLLALFPSTKKEQRLQKKPQHAAASPKTARRFRIMGNTVPSSPSSAGGGSGGRTTGGVGVGGNDGGGGGTSSNSNKASAATTSSSSAQQQSHQLLAIRDEDGEFGQLLESSMRSHSVLRNYGIEAPLVPGSGRMTRTYRLRRRQYRSADGSNASSGGGRRQQKQGNEDGGGSSDSDRRRNDKNDESVVVLKTALVDLAAPNNNARADLARRRRELERIRSRTRCHAHVAPFLAWWVAGQEDEEEDEEEEESTTADRDGDDGSGSGARSDGDGTDRRDEIAREQQQQQQQQQQQFPYYIPQLRPAFLVRPHLYTTLSDRLASRPWLTSVEKLWIVHQLLKALQQLHDSGIVHGFLTTENVGLTSYNYVVLLDLSSCYKARKVADDDPSEYLHYFQLQSSHNADATSSATATATKRSEKRCYLAPERFYTPSSVTSSSQRQRKEAGGDDDDIESDEAGGARSAATGSHNNQGDELTPAMDMFSAGCVITELLLNGERCLDLGEMIEYRRNRGKTMPAPLLQKLAKIESSHLRAVAKNMLGYVPSQRLSAAEYWQRLDAAGQFPTSAFEYLTALLERMTSTAAASTANSTTSSSCLTSPDGRIAVAAAHYNDVLWETVGQRDVRGQAYFDKVLGSVMIEVERGSAEEGETDGAVAQSSSPPSSFSTTTTVPSTTEDLFAEAERLLRELEDFDLHSSSGNDDDDTEAIKATISPALETKAHTPEELKIEKADRSPLCKSSLLIFLQFLLANIRNVQRPASKIVGLQLLECLAQFSSDEARLQRIVPVAISLVHDQDALVRARVIATLTRTLSVIERFSPFDSQVFPQYIFKRIAHLMSDSSLVVRVAFAKHLAVIAETAHRFLDIRHAVRLYEAVEGGGGGPGTPLEETKSSDDKTAGNVFTDDLTKLLDSGSSELAGKRTPTEIDGKTGNPLVATGKILINSTYNSELSALQDTVSRWVVQITTDQSDQSALPKRSLLNDIGRLCQFFGLDGVMSFILPQVLAFLNDRKSWELRAALFDALPSLCHVIGRGATEEFVLPCVEIGLVDVEEFVIARALLCLKRLVDMNLISRSYLLGDHGSLESTTPSPRSPTPSLLKRYGVLLIHPSNDIRNEAIKAFATACNVIGSPSREIYFLPVIRPLLRFEPSSKRLCSEQGLRSCLVTPWTRDRFIQEQKKVNARGQNRTDEDTWTSVGFRARDEIEEIGASAPSRKTISPEQLRERNNENLHLDEMREYLRMLARHTVQAPSQDRPASSSLSRSEVFGGIEGSVKLAQSVMFPRQDSRLHNESLPGWYSSLRDTAEAQDTLVTESSAIRSVSALGHVYGLSIMGPVEGAAESIVGAADDSTGAEYETADALRSKKSKVLEASFTGQWGAEAIVDPDIVDTSLLVTKLKALDVPPLPPNFGDLEPLQTPLSSSMTRGTTKDSAPDSDWKPRFNAFVASSSVSSNGHTAPVARLAVSADNNFFVSGSHDGTCRVWEIPKVEESVGILESSLVYSGHSDSRAVRVNDVAMVEGSHSVVSGASDGSVRIWRVDMITSPAKAPSQQSDLIRRQDRSKAVGTTGIRQVHPNEGEILAVSHFNSLSASVVTYSSQKGCVHSWDLRCPSEPFSLRHGPELGHLSSIVLGVDRNWVVTGTNRGYLALWDVRFQQAVKLWRHSRRAPVSRLATSVVMTSNGIRPFVFVAAGSNECAMFDAVTGSCRECFRAISGDTREFHSQIEDTPFLEEVPMSMSDGSNTLSLQAPQPMSVCPAPPVSSINCMVGSIGTHTYSYLITGGSDSRIRFWDFGSPSKCYVVGGTPHSEPRPSFERIDFDGQKRLMLCRHPRSPSFNKQFSGVRRPESQHNDAIQDLKIIGGSSLISCSRDCTIKVWR